MAKANTDTAQLDLLIQGGTVHFPSHAQKLDVGVRNGTIAALYPPGAAPRAAETIDANGRDVLPGLWHVHVHFREPGHTYKEDFATGSQAAAAGGITFCIDMTNNDPHPTTGELFTKKRELVEKKAFIDFGLYGGGLYPKAVPDLVKAGAIGIKIFNTRHVKEIYPYISELGVVDHGILYELFEAAADADIITAVHHDDSEWCKRMTFRDYIDAGRTDNAAYMECYQKGYMYGHGMVAGLAASLYYARLAKVRLHVLHMGVMPRGAFDLVRHAKEQYQQEVTSELEVASMMMTREQADKVGPYVYLWAHDAEEGWRNFKDGTCEILVGEHAPHSFKDVEGGWKDNFSVPLGATGAQEFIPLLLNEVNNGRITLQDLARACAEMPARVFGLFPKKGVIAVDSDADFTIVDMKKKNTFRDEDMLSKTGYTVYRGMSVKGMPVATIVRGKAVFRDGKIVGRPGYGQFTRPLPKK